MSTAYKITTKILFPEGAAPGAGSCFNRKIITRNGKGETILRGSALAGVLRRAYAEQFGVESNEDAVSRWFGSELDGDAVNESCVRVADTVINCNPVYERTHNMINRHTGAVAAGALVSLEAVSPGAEADISITLKPGVEQNGKCEEFISMLAGILGAGLLVGGNSNRGIGRMTVAGDIYCRRFALNTVGGAAQFLDAEYSERKTGVETKGDILVVTKFADSLVISLALGIPRGEDLLVGDGQDMDYALKPQSVTVKNGKSSYWRILGSSLRGIFRNWMTRLAVRDGESVRDSIHRWYAQDDEGSLNKYKPDLIGWGFFEGDERKKYQESPHALEDPILDLFGSMYKKSRIHITDAFSGTTDDTDSQVRMHVAVDRFSGGANEGALFDNQVLAGEHLRFPFTIILKAPLEKEIQWLIKTLRALHLGILHVGSSKGGGRLEIKAICAKGTGSQAITEFEKELN